MQATVVTLQAMQLVGYQVEATIEEFESGLGRRTYQKLVTQKDEIQYRNNDDVHMVQIYPEKSDFDPLTDRFIQIFGYEVASLGTIPPQMISHNIPESKYVTCTHYGLESELSRTYEFLYGEWMRETGNVARFYDFEKWDERYKPNSQDNEIDIFIALV